MTNEVIPFGNYISFYDNMAHSKENFTDFPAWHRILNEIRKNAYEKRKEVYIK